MGVRILNGVNELTSESLVGRSIEEVRRELRTPLNIGDGAEIFLNHERATDPATLLRQGDELEFMKPAGEKGA